MLNAVLQLVNKTVNGLALPGQQSPLKSAVMPPPMEPMDGTLAFVTPGRMTGKRQTMPRGAGFTQPLWAVDITLNLESPPTADLYDQVFYLAVDAVLMALFAVPMTAPLVDPYTEASTQLLAIGEDYGFQPGNWVTTASGRLVLFRGRISTTVKEALQTGAFAAKGDGS